MCIGERASDAASRIDHTRVVARFVRKGATSLADSLLGPSVAGNWFKIPPRCHSSSGFLMPSTLSDGPKLESVPTSATLGLF